MSQDDETFLSRWSRRKHEARRDETAEPEAAAPLAEPETAAAPGALAAAPPASTPVAPPEVAAQPPPELPPLDSLDGLRSDYQAFLGKTVDEDTRRSALKKLFGDPHFNQMDGLDVYVDDYTQFEPMPAAMRLTLRHAREFLLNSERIAMGLDPSPGFESVPPVTAAAASADTMPADPVTAAVAPADPELAATHGAAPGPDVASTRALDGPADAAAPAAGGLDAEVASTVGSTPAPRPAPTARDTAASAAAPPSRTA